MTTLRWRSHPPQLGRDWEWCEGHSSEHQMGEALPDENIGVEASRPRASQKAMRVCMELQGLKVGEVICVMLFDSTDTRMSRCLNITLVRFVATQSLCS